MFSVAKTVRGFAAFTLVAGLSVAPIAAKAHSLADALVFAYNNSDLVQQQRFLLRSSDEGVAQAQARFQPVLSYFASLSQNGVDGPTDSFTTSVGVNADWTVWDAGSRTVRLESTKELVLAARQNLASVEQQVLFNAVQAFLQLRSAIEAVALRESNLRLITQELRAAEDRFEVGEVTRTDVELARARLAQARSGLASAQGDVEIQRSNYILAIGRAPHALLTPPSPPAIPATVQAAEAIAMRTAPSLLAQQHTVKSNELLSSAAQRNTFGTVGVTGSVSTGARNGDETSSGTVGLRYSRTFYDGGTLNSLIRQTQAALEASRFGLAQEGRIVADGVKRSWAQLQVARAQVTATQQQVRASQLAFEGVREEARLVARTTLDVLDAEQELLDARNAVLNAQTSAYLAVYSVLQSLGLLSTEHLGLNVERYDVTDYYNAITTTPAGLVRSEQGARLDRILNRK
mgnify:FL=1